MDRITKKLLRYFFLITIIVISICLFLSTILLSKLYLSQQYKQLEETSYEIYDSYKNNRNIEVLNVSAVLVKGNSVMSFGPGKMMNLRMIDFNELKEKDEFINHQGQKFISYKYSSEIGDIVVFKNYQDSNAFMKVVYIVLSIVFIFSIILTIPMALYLGNKFTRPIISIQKASEDIAGENFDVKLAIDTRDEIEDLAESINLMANQLKHKYKLQRDFIANVSHDFKTPLSIIRNYSEAIKDGIVEEKQCKVFSEEIIDEVDRLNNLVSQIMQLSKLKDNKNIMEIKFFNLIDFVEEAYNKFSMLVKSMNIKFNLIIEEDLKKKNLLINGDGDYLYRVLYNFIDNAIKYSPKGGIVKLKVGSYDDGIKVSIKDEGQGISNEIVEDIWDRYYKHNSSGGMGLGLAISKEILIKHGFLYGVESEDGQGTEFYFIVPKNKFSISNQ
ncbi:hypothetical protein CPJCM30710_00670 [Clostridium polyendosporum]|uniref:histidine kinase n=1 Tax=Clostridium polyendosporum TaxID=69208 RepID=A0A919RX56_9CLOT|nr:HAMP domain-containing sensor histidine kinase [Clostridium polyendosporum]GIM27401.1 hypothetical protein CPJCM30710_00670 [Clostridium polyendosporum]